MTDRQEPDGTQQPPPSVPYPTTPYQPGSASVPPPPPPPAPGDYPPTSQFPAYGPPPEQHHYGPPPGAQPGPPPGRPPRKSNVPLIAVIVAVTLLLCGGVATAGVLIVREATNRAKEAVEPIVNPSFPSFPSEAPEIPDLPTDVPDLPDDLPTLVPGLPGGGAGRELKVKYEVTGDGPVQIVYAQRLDAGPKRLSNAELPWKLDVEMMAPTFASVTAIRSGSERGSITCKLIVDGEVVSTVTKEGLFATAACSKMVLE